MNHIAFNPESRKALQGIATKWKAFIVRNIVKLGYQQTRKNDKQYNISPTPLLENIIKKKIPFLKKAENAVGQVLG